jgi:hypothetical protein
MSLEAVSSNRRLRPKIAIPQRRGHTLSAAETGEQEALLETGGAIEKPRTRFAVCKKDVCVEGEFCTTVECPIKPARADGGIVSKQIRG